MRGHIWFVVDDVPVGRGYFDIDNKKVNRPGFP